MPSYLDRPNHYRLPPRPPARPPARITVPTYGSRALADLTEALRIGLRASARPKLVKGQQVEAAFRGYVREVHPDGTVDLAMTREPYAEPACRGVRPDRVQIVEAALAEPMVGDLITGQRLRETPWRRGTTIVDDNGDTYVLAGSGRWVEVDSDEPLPVTCAFDDFDEFDVVEIVHAPGKARRK